MKNKERDLERIESITFTMNTKNGWAEFESTVNGEEFAQGTAPSWHGVIDMFNETLHEAVWGGEDGSEGWLK